MNGSGGTSLQKLLAAQAKLASAALPRSCSLKRSSLTEDYLWRDSRGGAYGSEVMCRDVYGLGVAPRWQRIRVRVRVALRYWRATPRFGFGSRSGDWINGLLFSRIMMQPNLNAADSGIVHLALCVLAWAA